MKKLTPKQHLTVSNILIAIGAVFALIDIVFYDILIGENKNQPVLIILALVFLVLSMVYRHRFVKCPHCGDPLTGSKQLPQLCPRCGKSLDSLPTESDNL